MNIQTIIEHDGVSYDAELARIVSTELGVEDHGIFTFSLAVEFAGSGTSIGGYALDEYDKEAKERVFHDAFAMSFVYEIMKVVGTRTWEGLRGLQVYGLWEHTGRRGMGHGMDCIGLASVTGGRVFLFKPFVESFVNERKIAV